MLRHPTSQHDPDKPTAGSLLSVPESFTLSPRPHFPAPRHSSARVSKQHPPPRPTSPHPPPRAPRGQPRPRAPGAPGQEPARTRPARPAPHPRIPRIPAGGAWARVGARRAEACRGTAAKGGAGWGDALTPHLVPSPRGLLPRKTEAPKLQLGLTR